MKLSRLLSNFRSLRGWILTLCILWILFLLRQHLILWDGLTGPLTQPGLGENGSASYWSVPTSEIVEYSRGWDRYGYNTWLAERISLWRSLPDVRDPRCLNYTYNEDSDEMKSASIIVIFRNEQLFVLLRTLFSLVDRTPVHLYEEILLVDDHSDTGFWREPLSILFFDTYVRRYISRKVRFQHLKEPVGLIRARAWASHEAKADNLVFVDANVEVTRGWLPPLLATISEESLTLATPILDRLDIQTLAYQRSNEKRGIYDWALKRREIPLTKAIRDLLPKPYKVAAMRSSVFAISTFLYQDLSSIDMELQGFGGAELDLSFKVWRGHGRIVQVPCSRVGHLEPRDQQYLERFGDINQMGEQLARNLKRIVEVWLDHPVLKSNFYKYQPHLLHMYAGDLSMPRKLYNQGHYQSLVTYVDEVMPELKQFEPRNRTDYFSGFVRFLISPNSCLTMNDDENLLSLEPCRANNTLQMWTLTYLNDLRTGGHICAEVQPDLKLGYDVCHSLEGRQSWHYDYLNNHLVSGTRCLEMGGRYNIFVSPCNKSNMNQRWIPDHRNLEAISAAEFFN